MSPIRDEYELIEHPAWGLFQWNTHEIHLAWHKSTIIIISKVKMVQKYIYKNIVFAESWTVPSSSNRSPFLLNFNRKTIIFLEMCHILSTSCPVSKFDLLVGRVLSVVTSTDILKDILILVRSFILYLSIISTNQDRASAHFAFFNWFVPVSQVQLETHFFSQCLEEKIRSSLLKNKFKNTIWRL